MDQLILIINELQNVINTYKIPDLELPQIIVVGSQSSGKSSVMERIIGYDILPKSAHVATRCPIIIQLIHREDANDISALVAGNPSYFYGTENISKELQSKTDKIGQSKEGVISQPISLQLYGNNHPTLTLIDLPGIIRNNGELPEGTKEKISKLSENYAESDNSIILAISSGNVDLANSDSLTISKEYDPEGRRTLNVITKLDIVDKGVSISEILQSKYFKKSLGTICVVNRSQKHVTDKKSILETNKDEQIYFKERLSEIPGNHGIEVLIKELVKRLNDAIIKNIPTIEKIIFQRIQTLSKELEKENFEDKATIIHNDIKKFMDEYENLIKGNKKSYNDNIVGGAKLHDVLYNEFPMELNNCQVSEMDVSKVNNRIKNTRGKQEKHFSVKKPFRTLLFEEINQFLVPCIRCNFGVKELLKDFVIDIIKEFKIDRYCNLATKIEMEMIIYIDKKHKNTEEIIRHIIKSEEREIKNIKPENNLFKEFQNNIENFKTKAFDTIMSNALNAVGLSLFPQMKLLFTILNSGGLLNSLKNVLSQATQEKTPFQSSIPENIMSIISTFTTENGIEKDSILNFMYREKKLPEFLELIIQKSTKSSMDEKVESNSEIEMIKAMVKEHFKIIQKNILYNVPKLIQSAFIEDLLEGLSAALLSISQEDKDFLLDVTPEEEEKIKMQMDELKKLKDISDMLKNLKRHH